MERRRFLKYGALAAASAVLPGAALAQASPTRFELTVEPVDAQMIDGQLVYMLVYFGRGGGGGDTARPVLRAVEGDPVALRLTNHGTRPHSFAVPGVPGLVVPPVPPGGAVEVGFVAPTAGTYLYHDPTNAPVNRLLGLYGAMIIMPRNGGRTLGGAATPYGQASHTPAVRTLFEALGASSRFPGHRWDPDDRDRERIWIFSQTDPRLNAAADAGQTINAATVASTFLPRYFTINGLSGFDLSHEDPNDTDELHRLVCPRGKIGDPTLIRTLNAGLVTHSPHIHGNHVMELAGTSAAGGCVLRDNLIERDVWTLPPMDRKDVLLPFERPPDAAVWPPKQEPFPMRYVMHCHAEMSQTAAGGNYPQGAVLHWELEGP